MQLWHEPHRKHAFYYCLFSRCRGNNVSTQLFHSNGYCAVNCLPSCYLAMILDVSSSTSPHHIGCHATLITGYPVSLLSQTCTASPALFHHYMLLLAHCRSPYTVCDIHKKRGGGRKAIPVTGREG
jgi:hypothetical protein